MIEHCRYASPSGWNAIARRPASHTRLNADVTASFVVVGAGYAGLAAARDLAERFPDDKILLLDAGRPGEGSSGRNSGFMIDLPFAKISGSSDPEQRDWQTRLLGYGRRALREAVDAAGIRCDWRDIGHYKAATTVGGSRKLAALAGTLDAHGVEYRMLTPDDIRRELGTSHYTAAIWLRHCALVQPAELVHGLLAALPGNVQACFETPVTDLRRTQMYELCAGGHRVKARCVLLCVNTDLPGFGYAKYRQLTAYTYAGLTRELTAAESSRLGDGPDWGVTPVERLEATSRKVSGNRLMLRVGFSYKHELEPRRVRAALTASLMARYPGLSPDAFEHAWGGAVSLTRNDAPILRQLADGLYAVSGCNASGILKMTALGHLLAELACGTHSSLLGETLVFSRPSFIPPDPIRRLAVGMQMQRFQRELIGDRA